MKIKETIPNSVALDNSSSFSSTSKSHGISVPVTSNSRDVKHRIRLAEREQRRVAISKCAMILLFVVVATGLCAATFVYVRNEEEDDFHKMVRCLVIFPIHCCC